MMMTIVYLLLGVVLAGVVYFVAKRVLKQRRPSLGALKKQLQKLTHDSDVTARLVAAERKRNPHLSESAILKRVIRRLRRDRGR